MISIAFYDAKPYDKIWFDKYAEEKNMKIKYYESKLDEDTVVLSKNCDVVCAFVNDNINKNVIKMLSNQGVKLIAMRCAGYNNVDLGETKNKICVVRVPSYSPYAIAEHGIGMVLCLNRKLHKAYIRTRDFNFSLANMSGFDLHNKTVGIIGMGKIGTVFADICIGFGMKVLAYDPFYNGEYKNIKLTDFDEICRMSDLISLNCPLTKDNYHLINKEAISKMKTGVYILNTSRGGLIDSNALIDALKCGKIGAAALDVYEEESEMFFEDMSEDTDRDEKMTMLLSMPNVLITSHQAFLTSEALQNIADTTTDNIRSYFTDGTCINEVRH